MIKTLKNNIMVALIITVLINISYSQQVTSNILLGQSIAIDSKHLGETREIFVHTPDGYMNSEDHYPVLYVLDGETHFFTSSALSNFYARNQQIPNLIVVAIPNNPGTRQRDFTPPTDDSQQNLSGTEKFTLFMSDELFPIIESNYRTYDYKLLFGHSGTGLFSIYTLLNHIEIFDAIITASPYIMWNDDYIVEYTNSVISKMDFTNKSLYISIGDEPNYFESLDALTTLYKNNDTGLKWKYEKFTDEDHASIPVTTLINGLNFVFSDWPLTQEVAMGGLSSIQQLLINRLQKYGIQTELNENVINNVGYQLLQAERIDKAIEIFKYNVELYPNSSNVYDSLGDGYDAKGLRNKALKSYRKAVKIGTEENNPNLQIYKDNVDRLERNF